MGPLTGLEQQNDDKPDLFIVGCYIMKKSKEIILKSEANKYEDFLNHGPILIKLFRRFYSFLR